MTAHGFSGGISRHVALVNPLSTQDSNERVGVLHTDGGPHPGQDLVDVGPLQATGRIDHAQQRGQLIVVAAALGPIDVPPP